MSSRKPVAGGALIVMMLLGVAPGRAAADPGEDRITYVASDGTTWSTLSNRDTPAGRVAAAGTFTVYPRGKTFTLHIDDFGTEDGDRVRVSVSGNGLDFHGCLPVRTTRTFTGVTAGEDVHVTLMAVRALVPVPYDCPATAGVVTVTGVV
jgi:hypothetical protein